jgi:hypothetical protein
VDHRVEPQSWLPQGAAPQAADPEADEDQVSEDTHATKDESAADSSAEEYPNGNGHDGSYTYSRDDSYSSYGPPDRSFSGRGPFEEPTKPPFDELPGASYEPVQAPLPPADELAAGTALGGTALGGNEANGGLDGSAGTSLADSDYSSGLTGSSLGNGGFTGSSGTMASPDGAHADTARADTGIADTGMAGGGYAPGGYTPGGPASPQYTAAFPVTPAPTVTAPGPAPQAEHTGAYSYTAPERQGRQGRQAATGSARRANLVIARLEPWSVMKFSFLMSLVAWIVLFVAVALLYYALSSLGVFASLQKTLASVTSSQGSSGVDLSKWTSGTRVLGYTMLIGAVDVVLITALSTVGAVVYNLVTHLGGGIEVTLKETE